MGLLVRYKRCDNIALGWLGGMDARRGTSTLRSCHRRHTSESIHPPQQQRHAGLRPLRLKHCHGAVSAPRSHCRRRLYGLTTYHRPDDHTMLSLHRPLLAQESRYGRNEDCSCSMLCLLSMDGLRRQSPRHAHDIGILYNGHRILHHGPQGATS